MGLLGAAHAFLPPPPSPSVQNLLHMSYNDESWHSYTLPKDDPKTYKSRDTPLNFCWHQYFFTGNQQLLLYHEKQV